MNSVVSVGIFDGLHLGHLEILARADQAARRHAARRVVVTFDPHPDVVLGKTKEPLSPLTPLSEKRRRLEALGVQEFSVLHFTREMAALTPEEFVESHLVRPHAPRALVVGVNFALGKGRAGNVDRLAEIGRSAGFEVEAVPLLDREGGPVSSTRIRQLLATGDVAAAARLLGRRYGLEGRVVRGEAIGRTLGVPTANLALPEEKLIPANGIYAVWVRIPSEPGSKPGAMSVGVRPTFGGQARTLEVHLIDWQGELVGEDLEVEFVDWLRPEVRFERVSDLVETMRQDIAAIRDRLRTEPREGGVPSR